MSPSSSRTVTPEAAPQSSAQVTPPAQVVTSPAPSTLAESSASRHKTIRLGTLVSTWLTSSRIGACLAFIALGLGILYYVKQYLIAKRTFDIGVWKDCHDRSDIANTSICRNLVNTSYGSLAGTAATSFPLGSVNPTDTYAVFSQSQARTLHDRSKFPRELRIITVLMGYIVIVKFAPMRFSINVARWILLALQLETMVYNILFAPWVILLGQIIPLHGAIMMPTRGAVSRKIQTAIGDVENNQSLSLVELNQLMSNSYWSHQSWMPPDPRAWRLYEVMESNLYRNGYFWNSVSFVLLFVSGSAEWCTSRPVLRMILSMICAIRAAVLWQWMVFTGYRIYERYWELLA